MANGVHPQPLTAAHFMKLRESGAALQIVDVRTIEEWADFHIDGSLHIPLDELAGRANDIDAAQPVVFVCAHGFRSAHAGHWYCQSLARGPVYNLTGGLEALREGFGA